MSSSIILFALFNINFLQANAFTLQTSLQSIKLPNSHLYSSAVNNVDETTIESTENSPPQSNSEDDDQLIETFKEREKLKKKLFQLCASYDRGFGASPKARNSVQAIVDELEMMNPTTTNASRGIDGTSSSYSEESIPLKGAWRMIWTTALDVLNLGASPIATPSAIYQVFEPPICTNIIDFIPRIQFLLPTTFPSTLVRAEVKTRTSIRPSYTNRVGLNFEAVKLDPVEILGASVPTFIPSLDFNLPTSSIDIGKLPGVDPDNAPGYFDIDYLDDDMMIIKQNVPGGYFVLVKVDNYDP